jgi:hypothetical protein
MNESRVKNIFEDLLHSLICTLRTIFNCYMNQLLHRIVRVKNNITITSRIQDKSVISYLVRVQNFTSYITWFIK